MVVGTVRLSVVRWRCHGLLMAVDLEVVIEPLDLFRNLARAEIPFLAPFRLEMDEHAVRTKAVDLTKGTELGELGIGHAHVCFIALDLGGVRGVVLQRAQRRRKYRRQEGWWPYVVLRNGFKFSSWSCCDELFKDWHIVVLCRPRDERL